MNITPFEIFQNHIYPNIDNSIKVTKVLIDNNSQVQFEVCSTKWLRVGDILADKKDNSGVFWEVTAIVSMSKVIGKRISHTDNLFYGELLYLPMPVLKSGTERNLTGENSKFMKIGSLEPRPWIWCRENYTGGHLPKTAWGWKRLDYALYFVTDCNMVDQFNDQRHAEAVRPMQEVCDTTVESIDNMSRVVRVGETRFKTFPILGNEDKTGMVSLLLDLKLAGVELLITVEVAKELCTKQC